MAFWDMEDTVPRQGAQPGQTCSSQAQLHLLHAQCSERTDVLLQVRMASQDTCTTPAPAPRGPQQRQAEGHRHSPRRARGRGWGVQVLSSNRGQRQREAWKPS